MTDEYRCPFCTNAISAAATFCPKCGELNLLKDKYRIVRKLGQGGFGVVYQANDLHLTRTYAIKVIKSESSTAQQAVKSEANIHAQYARSFPFMPEIYDIIEMGTRTALVMEYIAGQTLEDMLEGQGAWSVPEVEQFLTTMLGYLAKLHEVGLVHRDIKPANVKSRGNNEYVMLDFGIAKQQQQGATLTGAKALSVFYSSPEQMRGEPTDTRSDLYSLGATAYHLLSGLPLPSADMREQSETPLPLPRQLAHNETAPLAVCLMRMLELQPEARPLNPGVALSILQGDIAPPTGSSAGQSTVAISGLQSGSGPTSPPQPSQPASSSQPSQPASPPQPSQPASPPQLSQPSQPPKPSIHERETEAVPSLQQRKQPSPPPEKSQPQFETPQATPPEPEQKPEPEPYRREPKQHIPPIHTQRAREMPPPRRDEPERRYEPPPRREPPHREEPERRYDPPPRREPLRREEPERRYDPPPRREPLPERRDYDRDRQQPPKTLFPASLSRWWRRWGFWFWWVLATMMGAGVGLGLAMPIGELAAKYIRYIPFPIDMLVIMAVVGAVVGIVFGAMTGFTQWFVLRHRLRRSGWWLLSSAMGLIVGGGLLATEAPQPLAVGAAVGTIAGVVLGTAIGRQVEHLVNSIGGAIIIVLIGAGVGGGMAATETIQDVALEMAILYGALTGFAFFWLLRGILAMIGDDQYDRYDYY